jgi:hypothetical protein
MSSNALRAALQARSFVFATFSYSGMPVPPEAKVEVFQSPEAQATFDAGKGGPLGTTPAMASGVWGPPIGMWRAPNMMPVFNVVRIYSLTSLLLINVVWMFELDLSCQNGHSAP